MVVGDQKKFLTCLLTLKVETDPETMEPKDDLTPVCIEWFQNEAKIKVKTLTEILTLGPNHDKIMKSIQLGMDRVNSQAISNAQKIQKFAILPTDFSVPGEELGPTLKLKRHFVLQKYSSFVENMYKI